MEAVLSGTGAALDLLHTPNLLERVAVDAPCFVGIADAKLQPVFVNPFGRRMVGLAEDFDVTTLSIPDFFAQEDRETVARVVLPTLLRDGFWEGEFRFRHFDGRDGILVKWSAFLLHDAHGEMIGVACFTTDLSQRLETESRLRESRARLKAAVDLVGLSSYRWDPQTGALEWDQRLKALWGVPPGALVDQALWLKGVHPHDRGRVQAAADSAVDPGGDGVYAIDYRVIGLNGGPERWVSTYGQTQFEHGRPVGFTGAVLDITEQKRVEAQLRRSESYLATILRQLPVGVSVFDVDGRLMMSNPAAERFRLGVMPSRSPHGRGRWRGFRADGAPLLAAEYPGARALRGETTFPGAEFLYSLDDGARIWARVSAAPLRDADGAIRGVVAIIEDVDQQRRNEARLRETEERFRRFAENSSDVIWILDVAGQRLDYLSPAFEQTWGRRPEEAIADPEIWKASIHPDDREARAQTLERVIARAEPIAHEYRILRPDGSVRWIRDTSFPIRDAEGRLNQMGGIAHDMSSHQPLSVYVVEPDDRAREAKAGALRRAGRRVTTFASEAGFLDVAGSLMSGCVLVRADEASPSPFALARALRTRRDDLPVIFEAALDGDVDLAIAAMKAGAADVLKAPADPASVLAAVASALANVRETEREARAAEIARSQIALMSPREREVLEGLLRGGTNKTIARDLGISPRTVEIHRARVMERLGAHTVPEAVLAATSAGVKPSRRPIGEA
jgi:PAS domain S-box-containing protein